MDYKIIYFSDNNIFPSVQVRTSVYWLVGWPNLAPHVLLPMAIWPFRVRLAQVNLGPARTAGSLGCWLDAIHAAFPLRQLSLWF